MNLVFSVWNYNLPKTLIWEMPAKIDIQCSRVRVINKYHFDSVLSAWKETKIEQRNQGAFNLDFQLWCHFIACISSCLSLFFGLVKHMKPETVQHVLKVCAIQMSVVSSTVYEVHQQPYKAWQVIRVLPWEEERVNDSHFTSDKCDWISHKHLCGAWMDGIAFESKNTCPISTM